MEPREGPILGVLGVGGTTFLASCSLTFGSSSSTSESNNSNSGSKDNSSGDQNYKGRIKFDSFEGSVSDYKPGTSSKKASGVPKPKPPEGMNEKTTAGLYKFFGYWLALLNYALLTGEIKEYVKILDKPEAQEAKDFVEGVNGMYSTNAGWVISPTNMPFNLELKENKPYDGPQEGTYIWTCDANFDSNAKIYSVDEPDNPEPLSKDLPPIGYAYFTYKNSAWIFNMDSVDGFRPKKFADI